ncbi:hypothetical protein V8C86DRAFT_2543935, partial [Haematococcus lacustris]
HSRLLVWLQHMIVVCKGACGEPKAHGEAESGQLQQSLHIGRLFYIKQHMQQYQDMLIKAEGMHMSLEGRGTCNCNSPDTQLG